MIDKSETNNPNVPPIQKRRSISSVELIRRGPNRSSGKLLSISTTSLLGSAEVKSGFIERRAAAETILLFLAPLGRCCCWNRRSLNALEF